VGRALTRKGAIPISQFGYRKIGKEESEASTHELARSRDLVQSPGCKEEVPWRVCCGCKFPDREIEEFFKSSSGHLRRGYPMRGHAHEHACIKWYQSLILVGIFQAREARDKEHSDTHQVVSEHRKASLLSVVEKRKTSPCHREEEIDNHPIHRKKGRCPEEGVEKCRIQK
jgi:hypothetical protein